ncbi:MAG: 2-amino-4-hydroxy-6-hydroxymethyldihydropteridine diphosphokinase [Alphaproteobacteria bacterium]|nr:2-amino-4-hydroxy-6-hydroxymethyldihydropteridine diphosphokinase [Alphaproteobacteria bacterium]
MDTPAGQDGTLAAGRGSDKRPAGTVVALVGLGANLPGSAGPPRAQLEAALAALGARGIAVVARSRFWRSAAWPDPSDPQFVNAVARVETALDARALMAALHDVEAALGRRRGVPNAPRTIDLDLLDHGGTVRDGSDGGPVLPHPRIAGRAFVLLPLAEVAPGWRDPRDGRPVAELLAALPSGAAAEPLDGAGE